MIGQVEETSSELFLSICSSRLEASQARLQRLQLFLKMSITVSALFIFHVSRSKSGVCRLFGDLYFNMACMYVIYNDVCKCMYMRIREFIL